MNYCEALRPLDSEWEHEGVWCEARGASVAPCDAPATTKHAGQWWCDHCLEFYHHPSELDYGGRVE